jgi:hypothetical protein
MSAVLRMSYRLYGWLLVLHPLALRSRYGQEMTDVFEQQIWEAWQLDSFRVSRAFGPARLKSSFWLPCRLG